MSCSLCQALPGIFNYKLKPLFAPSHYKTIYYTAEKMLPVFLDFFTAIPQLYISPDSRKFISLCSLGAAIVTNTYSAHFAAYMGIS